MYEWEVEKWWFGLVVQWRLKVDRGFGLGGRLRKNWIVIESGGGEGWGGK